MVVYTQVRRVPGRKQERQGLEATGTRDNAPSDIKSREPVPLCTPNSTNTNKRCIRLDSVWRNCILVPNQEILAALAAGHQSVSEITYLGM